MDLQRARALMLALPHVAETLQWGEKVVFWAGKRESGGRMFAIADLSPAARHVLAFAAGPERARALCEHEGVLPAPYLARAHWVAVERWEDLSATQWREELRSAHGYVWQRLPARTRNLFEMSLKPGRRR